MQLVRFRKRFIGSIIKLHIACFVDFQLTDYPINTPHIFTEYLRELLFSSTLSIGLLRELGLTTD